MKLPWPPAIAARPLLRGPRALGASLSLVELVCRPLPWREQVLAFSLPAPQQQRPEEPVLPSRETFLLPCPPGTLAAPAAVLQHPGQFPEPFSGQHCPLRLAVALMFASRLTRPGSLRVLIFAPSALWVWRQKCPLQGNWHASVDPCVAPVLNSGGPGACLSC